MPSTSVLISKRESFEKQVVIQNEVKDLPLKATNSSGRFFSARRRIRMTELEVLQKPPRIKITFSQYQYYGNENGRHF